MTGKKRGKYNVEGKTKALDDLAYVKCTVFKKESIQIDGEEYLEIILGGRIRAKEKDIYRYVKLGKAPDDWVTCLDNCKLLSAVKREEAKQARH